LEGFPEFMKSAANRIATGSQSTLMYSAVSAGKEMDDDNVA
jgi:hypothetical protein